MDETLTNRVVAAIEIVIEQKLAEILKSAGLDPMLRSGRWAEGPLNDIRLALEIRGLVGTPG